MRAAVKRTPWTSPSRRDLRMAATLLVLAAALAAQGCSVLRRRAEERPPYRKVSPPIAYEILRDTQGLLILDLRSPQAFHGDTGHIARAFNIPVDQLPYRLIELSSFRDQTFLVYCDTASCGDEGMRVLVSSGFDDALLIDGGIDRWIARGFRTVLPVELAGTSRPGNGAAAEPASRRRPIAEALSMEPPAAQAFQPDVPRAVLPALCPEPHVQVQKPP